MSLFPKNFSSTKVFILYKIQLDMNLRYNDDCNLVYFELMPS